jgi:hypothetical protein
MAKTKSQTKPTLMGVGLPDADCLIPVTYIENGRMFTVYVDGPDRVFDNDHAELAEMVDMGIAKMAVADVKAIAEAWKSKIEFYHCELINEALSYRANENQSKSHGKHARMVESIYTNGHYGKFVPDSEKCNEV